MSWLPLDPGYLLAFNRDERPSRTPAAPPAVRQLGPALVLAPVDGDHGGTWLGVNRAGVTVGLANRYGDDWTAEPARKVSRGHLVAALLAARSADDAVERHLAADLARFDPHTIVILDRDTPPRIVTWGGEAPAVHWRRERGIVITSSGVDGPAVLAARLAALDAAVGEHGWTEAALVAAHTSHLPERGAHSVCMHRDEAHSVSLSVVRVAGGRAGFAYAAGQPCVTPLAAPVVMALAAGG